jgi:putative ABC transport system substrate-binding protein
VWLVGVIMTYPKDGQEMQGWMATFRQALEGFGRIEGKNIKFDYRPGTDAALLEQAAEELVTLHPDVILAPSSPATAFVLKQTSTIPVNFVNIVDPEGQGRCAATCAHHHTR